MHNHPRTTHVPSTRDHDDISRLKLDVIDDFVLYKVELDRVIDLDGRVGITDGTAVMGDDMRHSLCSELVFSDFAELEGRLFGTDSVNGKSTLDIVE